MPRVYTARLEKSSDPNANEPVARPCNALLACANSARRTGHGLRLGSRDKGQPPTLLVTADKVIE